MLKALGQSQMGTFITNRSSYLQNSCDRSAHLCLWNILVKKELKSYAQASRSNSQVTGEFQR